MAENQRNAERGIENTEYWNEEIGAKPRNITPA
jgi:hypothetical protein